MPLTSFAEPLGKGRGNQCFAASDEDDNMFFPGIEVRARTSVREVKDGEIVDDLFAFLTCPPNEEVKAAHPKAMPVILKKPAEWDAWMSVPADRMAELPRPLPDGRLRLVNEPM